MITWVESWVSSGFSHWRVTLDLPVMNGHCLMWPLHELTGGRASTAQRILILPRATLPPALRCGEPGGLPKGPDDEAGGSTQLWLSLHGLCDLGIRLNISDLYFLIRVWGQCYPFWMFVLRPRDNVCTGLDTKPSTWLLFHKMVIITAKDVGRLCRSGYLTPLWDCEKHRSWGQPTFSLNSNRIFQKILNHNEHKQKRT